MSITASSISVGQPLTIDTEAETRFPEFARALLESGIESFCAVPLMVANRRIGVLGLASTKPGAFRDFKLQFAQRGSAGANVGGNAPVFKCPSDDESERDKKTFDLKEEVQPDHKFDDIIGRSASLRAMLDEAQVVAPPALWNND